MHRDPPHDLYVLSGKNTETLKEFVTLLRTFPSLSIQISEIKGKIVKTMYQFKFAN